MCVDLINNTVFQSLLSSHEVVAIGIALDLLNGLAGILGEDAVAYHGYGE